MIPAALIAHYQQLIAGTSRRVVKQGISVGMSTAWEFGTGDLETMKRLMDRDVTGQSWRDLEAENGADWLPRVFDALWTSNHDWLWVRNDGQKTRKALAAAKITQIKSATEKLGRLLDEFRSIVAPTGAGPGQNLDAWPDSPALRNALSSLTERCERFDLAGMRHNPAANAVLSARESGREYLRALVATLDGMEFRFGEKRTPSKALIDLADIAAGTEGAIDYDAFYAVLQPEKKSRRQ